MIIPNTYITPRPGEMTWGAVLIFILLLAAIAGRQAIAWLLLRLYELFIQKNPLQL